MSTAFKIGIEESFDGFSGDSRAEDICAEADNVSVIVTSCHFGFKCVVNESGANAVDFVSGHGNADTGAADDDAGDSLMTGDGASDGGCEIGIIAGSSVISTFVVDNISHFSEHFFEVFFHCETGMVTTDCEFFTWFEHV